MVAFDPLAHLETTTRAVLGRLVNDLKAVPADQQNVSPGGCARPPLNFVAECGSLNGFIAEYLTTGAFPQRPDPATRDAFLASFDTEEKAITYLNEQTETLITALRGIDPGTLGDPVNLFGRELTRYFVAELPAMHMAYHDGQLNYVHGLCGDAAMHWG